jgi:hypothetical protein
MLAGVLKVSVCGLDKKTLKITKDVRSELIFVPVAGIHM